MADRVQPEDPGINSNLDPDWNDAAITGQIAHDPALVDSVIKGLEFTVDYGVPDFDLSSGSCRFLGENRNTVDHSASTPSLSSFQIDKMVFTAQIDSRSGESLTDSDTNYIYIQYDPSTQDSISIITKTTESLPTKPAFKLGEIDTSADTSFVTNRGPKDSGSINFSNTPVTINHGIGTKKIDASFFDNNDNPVVVDWTPDNPAEITVDANISDNNGTYIVHSQ